MQLRVLICSLLFLLCATSAAAAAAASGSHNITRILAKHPEFSTFNHYLTVTHLADEINRRVTITVCAIDNAAMNDLLGRHFSISTVKNVLSLHIFADYFGAKKLHQITHSSTTTSSLFQATGEAAGTSGYVNVTDLKGGKVGFTPVDAEGAGEGRPMATFVKSVEEHPYVISVIQISHLLSSPEAEAPTASPTDTNVTTLMARQGCQSFADLVDSEPDARTAFQHNVESGLTVFCPSDDSLDSFMASYKNLTADDKIALIKYHATSEYNSLGTLRSSPGVMNTLASGPKRKFDFTVKADGDQVSLHTKVVTAHIIGTLIDADPFAAYEINTVLLPKELYKEAPEELAPSPKPSKAPKKAKSKSGNAAAGSTDDEADSPGPSSDDDGDVADAEASRNGGERVTAGFVSVLALVIFAWNS